MNTLARLLASSRARSRRGFTLIELLVVIMIMGILIAVALPVFLGQQSKGHHHATMARTAVIAPVVSHASNSLSGGNNIVAPSEP